MAHIGIVRIELQCLGVRFGGFSMSGEARQCVALQAEQARVDHTGDACILSLFYGHGEVTAANRKQGGSIAQLDAPWCSRDAGGERGEGGIGIACCLVRRGQVFAIDVIRWVDRNRLAEAGDCILGTPEFQHQDAKQPFGSSIVAVEDHRFRSISGRTFPVTHLSAQIGSAPAQAGMVRRLRHGLIQLFPREFGPSFTHCQPSGELRQIRRRRCKPAHSRKQRSSGAQAIGIDQRGKARRQHLGIGGGL